MSLTHAVVASKVVCASTVIATWTRCAFIDICWLNNTIHSMWKVFLHLFLGAYNSSLITHSQNLFCRVHKIIYLPIRKLFKKPPAGIQFHSLINYWTIRPALLQTRTDAHHLRVILRNENEPRWFFQKKYFFIRLTAADCLHKQGPVLHSLETVPFVSTRDRKCVLFLDCLEVG